MEFYQKVALRTAKEMGKMLLFLSMIFGGLFIFVWGGSFLGLSSIASQVIYASALVTGLMASSVVVQLQFEAEREERKRAREES